MTEIIITFKMNAVPDDFKEMSDDDINDMFREAGEKSDMDLVSWGTI